MPARRYEDLQVGKAGTLFALEANVSPAAPATVNVHRFDLAKRKADMPYGALKGFKISFGGEKALCEKFDGWKIANGAAAGQGPGGAPAAG